ncbi:MAG: hypothetical protein PHQ28_15055 [Mycobacterium sp.]|nr:hypothetical protein [Mycobacterium sp.]
MNADCPDCRAGLDHCHGTIVRHALRRWECTEPDCTSPELCRHTFGIDCDAIGCGGCSESTALAGPGGRQPIGSMLECTASATAPASASG